MQSALYFTLYFFCRNFTIFFYKIEVPNSFDWLMLVKHKPTASKKLDTSSDLQRFEKDVDKLDSHETTWTSCEVDTIDGIAMQKIAKDLGQNLACFLLTLYRFDKPPPFVDAD